MIPRSHQNTGSLSRCGSVLFDIWLLVSTIGGGRMLSRTLVQGLNALPDRPWREKTRLRGTTARQGNGKGITEAWLAEQLQAYGIRPGPMRLGQVQARGYFEADFQEAFQRYMCRSEMDALRASLQQQQARVDREKRTEDRKPRTEPPTSDFSATRDGGQAARSGTMAGAGRGEGPAE
jgi:hypothetical protein